MEFFESKILQNGGSVGKLYFNSNGGNQDAVLINCVQFKFSVDIPLRYCAKEWRIEGKISIIRKILNKKFL